MNAPDDRVTVQTLWESSSRRLRAWFERRTGSSHDADDLVQETFTRVQAMLASLRDGERLVAWVRAIAAIILADHARKRVREGVSFEEAEAGSELAESTTCEDESEGLRAAVAGWLEAFLRRLGPEDAAVIRAVDFDGRAQVDVARELGLAPSSVRSRVQRARARLRTHLEACCKFAFDARGGLSGAMRRPGSSCDCETS